MWKVIGSVLALAILIFKVWVEKDKGDKAIKKEALKEIADGIKKRDTSRITNGCDTIRRLRK